MNEFFQNLKNEAFSAKLSSNEKQAIRVALYEAMKIPQPPATTHAVNRKAVHSPYVWFSPRFALPVAVLLITGLGTGTAFAAQGALPGDVLYPVKINVNEQVEVALATTPIQKAQTEADIADRRVAEAQTLAAQGRLDATTTQELEDNFEAHASRALALVGEEPAATTSATTSAAVSTEITGAVSTSSSTTTAVDTANAPKSDDRGAFRAPRTAAFKIVSTTPEATSTETESTSTPAHSSKYNLSESLQKQRNILNDLKVRVGRHERDASNSGDQNNSQNNFQSGGQSDNQNNGTSHNNDSTQGKSRDN